MKNKVTRIAIAVQAVVALAACQSAPKDNARDNDLGLRIVPAEDVRHGASQPEALYALGRYYGGQMRHDKAIDAYQRLLAAYPDHGEGRNALGMLLANQGQYDAAIAELEKAVVSAPNSARIRNNLGYAYLLRGNFAQAVAALETAAQLDPNYQRARDNLQTALASSGTGLPAAPASIVATAEPAAVAVKTEPVGVESPAAAAPPPPLAPPPAMKAAPAPAATVVDGTRLIPVAQNMYLLSLASPVEATRSADVPPAPAPAAPREAAPAGQRVRLEVANGNGITGMARLTSRQLQDAGYAKPRLTNEKPYRLAATEIQYRPGYEPQARQLQTELRPGVAVVPSVLLRADVQLRLALGRDVRSSAELVARAPSPSTAGHAVASVDKDAPPAPVQLAAHALP